MNVPKVKEKVISDARTEAQLYGVRNSLALKPICSPLEKHFIIPAEIVFQPRRSFRLPLLRFTSLQ